MRRFFSSWILFSVLALIVNISAMAVVQAGSLYADLDDKDIYIYSITQLSTNEVVHGYEDGTYKPEQAINRAEFLKIAMAWYGTEIKTLNLTGSNCYTDVADQWFAPYVCAATEMGIVKGYDDHSFHPDYPITFIEASKIIVNVFGLPVQTEGAENWYQPYVEAMANKELIVPTIVSLTQEVDRGETAEMVYGSTDASGGNWPTTYYNDLNTGALDFYRVVTSSPGASTFYTYLIDGTKAIYLEGTQRAAINPSQTQLAYLESKDWLSTLMVKDLATGTILKTFTDVDGGEVNGFSWSEDGEQVRWTAISYENSEFEGVVVVNQVDLESETVASFETNSWFHCGGSCYPYPFVWAEGKTYGAILTFLYDEQDDENSYFLIYNSLGQEIGTTAPLTRLNTEPSRYNWSESGEGLIAEYSDGSSEAIAVTWK